MSKDLLLADSVNGGVRVLASEWIPLPQAALCLDCETVFRLQTACPRCGSKTWTLLAAWLEAKPGVTW